MGNVTIGPLAGGQALPRPRLRHDRVVVRLLRELDDALRGQLPAGTTVIVTITAPIRSPAKTVAGLFERILSMLDAADTDDAEETIAGNQVRIRIATTDAALVHGWSGSCTTPTRTRRR